MVLKHLKTKGPRTQREAERLYGIGRLAARVHDWKAFLGKNKIERELIMVRKANGEKARVAQYYLTRAA